MAEAFIGEIRMFAGNFAPKGWAFCDGSLLPVAQNEALSDLISNKYGGDGATNIALPNFQTRIPLHWGTMGNANYPHASSGGDETVMLNPNQLPSHTHAAAVTPQPALEDDPKPDGVFGAGVAITTLLYAPNTAPLNAALHASALAPTGGGTAHNNQQPYLKVTFILSLYGIYPEKT